MRCTQPLLDASEAQKNARGVNAVPRFAVKTLRKGGCANGMGVGAMAPAAAAGGGGGLSRAEAEAAAASPPAYVSPAFEQRLSAIHALELIGRDSPTCRDTALLLLLLARGGDVAAGGSSIRSN